MAPQLNEKGWITRSQVDPVTAWNKHARYAAVRLRYECGESAQWTIGATRCDDSCVNIVLLETQGPCGSVRRCSDDTAIHDTSVQGRCHMNQRDVCDKTKKKRRISAKNEQSHQDTCERVPETATTHEETRISSQHERFVHSEPCGMSLDLHNTEEPS